MNKFIIVDLDCCCIIKVGDYTPLYKAFELYIKAFGDVVLIQAPENIQELLEHTLMAQAWVRELKGRIEALAEDSDYLRGTLTNK